MVGPITKATMLITKQALRRMQEEAEVGSGAEAGEGVSGQGEEHEAAGA